MKPNADKRYHKRGSAGREADIPVIGQWYAQGFTLHQISVKLTELRGYSLSQSQLFEDLKVARAEWTKTAAQAIDEHKAKELAKLDLLESTYWERFEASKKDRLTTRKVGRPGAPLKGDRTADPELKVHSVEVITTKTDGDMRWLQGVLDCVRTRCAIMGINAAVQHEISAQVPIEIKAVGLESDHVKESLLASLRREVEKEMNERTVTN